MANSLGVTLTADNSGFLAKMVEAGTVTEREAKRMQRSLQFVSDQLRVMNTAQKAANDAGPAIAQSAKHMEEFGFHTAAAKRELLVLGHELSQGNYSRFGGSLLVLGERTGAAALLFSGMGVAVLAATAAVGAFAFAVLKGNEETDKLNKALALTGGYSAMTADEMTRMSGAISNTAGKSFGAAREALQELVTAGRFGPQVMQSAGEAVLKMEKLTGKSADEIVKDFVKMSEAPAKWAEENNRSLHFVTAAQYEHIKSLEDMGQKEQAVAEVLQLLNVHLNRSSGFWDKLKIAASEAWDEMVGTGRAETIGDKIAAIDKQLAKMDELARQRRGLAAFSSAPDGQGNDTRAGLNEERRQLALQNLQVQEHAAAKAEAARVQEAGIDAKKFVDAILSQSKSVNNLNRELALAKRNFADLAAAGTPASASDQKDVLDAIRKKYSPKGKTDPWWMHPPVESRQSSFRTSELQGNEGVNLALREANLKQYEKLVEQDKKLSEFIDKKVDEQSQRDLERSKTYGEHFQEALGNWANDAGEKAKFAERLVTGSFSRMEDAIINFTHTGKLNFKDLFGFMADEFLREQIRMAEKQYLTDGQGNFSLSGLGGLGTVLSDIGGFFGFGHATGLDYVPYDGYPAVLHEGERVQTKAQARATSAGGTVIDMSGHTINVGQGVSRAEVAAALQAQQKSTVETIRRLDRTGRFA